MSEDRSVPATLALSNWRHPRHIRWALRNMGFLPNVVVPRGATVREIPAGPSHDAEAFTYDWQGERTTLLDAMTQECADGYLVIHNDRVVYERYFGDFREHDHHLWASATKSLVSTAFGCLQDEHDVDTGKTPADYLPELAGSAFADVSIRQVLNMTTALDYTEEYEKMTPGSVHFEYFRRLGFVADFELMAANPLSHPQGDTARGVRSMLPRVAMRSDGEPGAIYEYQSPNVDVIGWLIERLSGLSLQDYVQSRIWSRLGAEHDALFCTDQDFAPIATGGFNTSLRDAARFGLAALHEGDVAGEQIWPAAWMADTYALSDADLECGGRSIFCEPGGERYLDGFQGYRSFWWVWDRIAGERQAMGVHGQVIYVNKAKNLVIATFASPEQTANVLRPSFKRLMAGTRALAAALS
jgi:hypothetical protein